MRDGTEPGAAGGAAVSRRGFLALGVAAAGLAARASSAGERWPSGQGYRPLLRIPAATANGARVPIVVDVSHPMEPDDHVGVVRVVNPHDPVPLKGTFHFTPANGRAFCAFQARLDDGPSTLEAVAECGRHGTARATAPITIAEGGGGCAGGPAASGVAEADDIRAPMIRIPQLVADGRISAGDLVDVQVRMKHPNRTGLARPHGRLVQADAPFHLDEVEVFYAGERVSRFVLTAALSDNPLITFKLRPTREGTIRVTLRNTRGARFEATHPLRFA